MKERLLRILTLFGIHLAVLGYAPHWLPAADQPAGASVPRTSDSHTGHGAAPSPEETPADPWAAFEEKKTVSVPAGKQQMIGVKTVAAESRSLHKIVRTIGRIEYDERRLTTINSKIEGWIEKLYIDYTGDFVKKDTPVAEIYSPELYATQQELLNVLKWTRNSQPLRTPEQFYHSDPSGFASMLTRDSAALLEAARQRLRLWDITDAQIATIEKTGIPLRTLTIFSQTSGNVLQKNVLQGMRVMAGEKLLDLVDLSSVWVIADIYEYDLPFVKPGQQATISMKSLSGKKFDSTIDFLYPTLAGETRTAKARFTTPNPGGLLKPQMYSDVEIFIELGKVLALPEAAIINTGNHRLVYIDKGDGDFEPREITTGIQAEGFIEVTSGLDSGDRVVSEANFLIDSEARLKGLVQ